MSTFLFDKHTVTKITSSSPSLLPPLVSTIASLNEQTDRPCVVLTSHLTFQNEQTTTTKPQRNYHLMMMIVNAGKFMSFVSPSSSWSWHVPSASVHQLVEAGNRRTQSDLTDMPGRKVTITEDELKQLNRTKFEYDEFFFLSSFSPDQFNSLHRGRGSSSCHANL